MREGPSREALVRRFYAVDRDHNKAIDFAEFVAFCRHVPWHHSGHANTCAHMAHAMHGHGAGGRGGG